MERKRLLRWAGVFYMSKPDNVERDRCDSCGEILEVYNGRVNVWQEECRPGEVPKFKCVNCVRKMIFEVST